MSDILGMLRTTTQLNQIAEEHFDIVGAKFKRNFRVKDVRVRNSKTYAESWSDHVGPPRDAKG